MKTISLLLFLFTFSHLSAQVQSGAVIYGVKIDKAEMQEIIENMDKNPQAEAYARTYLRNLMKNTPFLEYSLSFNTDSATFIGKEAMANDNGNDLKRTSMTIAGHGVYYHSKSKTIQKTKFQNKLYRIRKKDVNWDVIKESKIIKGYKCYKATTAIFFNEEPVVTTAWFCPDLPFQFGPRGFSGLPGLILELNYNNKFLFYPKKIVLSKKMKSIEEPCEGELISEKDFDKMLDRHAGFYKD